MVVIIISIISIASVYRQEENGRRNDDSFASYAWLEGFLVIIQNEAPTSIMFAKAQAKFAHSLLNTFPAEQHQLCNEFQGLRP